MDSHLQQLIDYVAAQVQAGQSPDVVMQQLVAAGWPADMVHQAFMVIQQRTVPSAMQTQPAAEPAPAQYDVQQQPVASGQPSGYEQQPIAQQFAQQFTPHPEANGKRRGRLKVGWTLLKQSLHILNGNRYLLRYLGMTWVAVLMLNAIWCGLVFLLWQQLQSDVVWYGFLFLSYLTIYCAINFYTAALAGNIFDIFRGVRRPYADYVRQARGKLGPIVIFSLIAALIGVALEYIAERIRAIGWIISWIIGAAWSIGSMFTLPIIMDSNLGAVPAIKQSFRLFKHTWGESVTAKVVLNTPLFIIQFAYAFVVGSLFSAVLLMGAYPLVIAIGIIYLVGMLSLAVIGSFATNILNTALYFYAINGQVPPGYDADMLNKVFIKRKIGLLSKKHQ